MKIANIIYEDELVNHTKVGYVNYINTKKKYEDIDRTLPTLYVGWSFMKDCNPDNELIQNADILRKKIISNELYWEFTFQESKSSHVKGVDGFVESAPGLYFTPKYKYTNLDPVFFQLSEHRDVLDVLPKQIDAAYIHKGEMLYLLCGEKITGLSLKTYEFFQFNTTELIKDISSRVTQIVDDPKGSMYLEQYKIFPKFTHLKRYLVVILTK